MTAPVPVPIAAPVRVLSSCALAARGRVAKVANTAPIPKMKILRMIEYPFFSVRDRRPGNFLSGRD
jgi:hypothetical protein